jgi:UTP--glucose-1-phosphate uridylyltransferase
MLSIFDETNQSVVAVQQMAREELAHYGVVEVEEPWQGAGSILSIVEKPDPKVAPSDLGVVGRYVLQPEILDILSALPPGASNEIQLTDAISQHIKLNNAMALEFSGQRYDCGNKLGYLKAVMRLGLQHPELGQSLNNYLNTLLKPKEGVLLPKESMSI